MMENVNPVFIGLDLEYNSIRFFLSQQMLTDWQHYLTQCIETIALVAEVKPKEVFEQVYSEWSRPFAIFDSLKRSIDVNGSLIINDNQHIYCILRDLSSLCQTLTHLAPILQGMNIFVSFAYKSFVTIMMKNFIFSQ